MIGFLFIRIYSNKFPLSQNCACENDVGKFKRECMNLKNLLLYTKTNIVFSLFILFGYYADKHQPNLELAILSIF